MKPTLAKTIAACIAGDVDSSDRARAEYATDASNYRVPPQLVVCPKNDDDVAAVLRICREHSVPLTARGGGTSVAGNAVGEGVILDFSRYMNAIEIDPVARTARVQPGVVMSDLQAAAAPHGLRFGPDPSTQNRATLGGMIGNNACGPHAVAWGRTADNVVSLECLDGTGRRFTAGAGQIDVPGLARLVDSHLADIRRNFGRFSRQVSGYSLEHLLPEAGRDVAKMLVGSEGTLVVITRAVVRLVPLAQAPTLVVLGYPDMPAAADAVPALLAHSPLAVEGIDAQLVDVVRRKKGSVPELPEGGGWLFIEVGAQEGEDVSVVGQRVDAILRDAGTNATRVCPPGPEASELWRIRADGAGLGGRTPKGNAAWPGWEDSAVPPEKLGPYLRDLRALMDAKGLDGLMYGHFGDGCVHVRIDFPIETPDGVAIMRAFMEEAADVAVRYGGSLSGEHGDGRARSELLTRMYPPEVIELFGAVKALFDPEDVLNPGVLVRPRPLDADLRRPHAAPSTYAGGFHFREDDGDLTRAVHRCTGVGNCRANRTAAGFFMCPSYQATKEEKDATRGRARVLQEVTSGKLIKGFADAALRESLDLCLACKACSADCPTGVNLAKFKSEALYRGYAGKLRPRTHYLLGNLPLLARWVTAVPGLAALANAALKVTPLRKVVFAVAGLDPRRQMPGFATTRFSALTKSQQEAMRRVGGELAEGVGVPGGAERGARPGVVGEAASGQCAKKYVMLWADSFSETLDTAGAQAMVGVLQRAGYTVLIPPSDTCCGLTWITTGQLDHAKKELDHLLGVLAPFAASGIPIVGVEPSCTAVLREDMPDLLDDPRASLVSHMTYTLAELLTAPAPIGPEGWTPPDLSGLTIVAQPHCHHYSVMGWRADAELLRRAGAKLTTVSGCCGLAGNFGMERGHYEVSVKVAGNDLLPKLAAAPDDAVYLADGFSCRTQAAQLAGDQGVHLAELLRDGVHVRRKGAGR
ncbi:FAD-binding and (Fe-S)-binding domain-containing protein [Trueperella abortisuis]|uniref:FAD/FMN-containing dehydrogenase/Fe-S oxidoreductase n=1 Tax=Trueperella abortisuis TaxID=445930 RepID=A0ABT9PKB1_9ACTO|nr:FAD-binding and (Fe-S)-binding domain-containing protein [Trueperella abortisuis]MDP9833164.1 FAD/FMN-containing dehydrogenase/Fe-S oxidoreductase [Trueperella abortisuis]